MLHKDDELHILRLPKIMNTFSKDGIHFSKNRRISININETS